MEKIIIKGACENNLKSIDLELPKNKFIVMTGVSGSGKTSLAFDTLCAEGQRRYMESLSSYARMFIGQMKKPDVESIEGLSPTISIAQKTVHSNPRSTVGTITEIYDYYRLLFAKVGRQHCPKCHRELESVDVDQIIDFIYSYEQDTKIGILAPIIIDRKTEGKTIFQDCLKAGYRRVVVNNEMYSLDNPPKLDKNFKYSISVVVDRLKISRDDRMRLSTSVEKALQMASGLVEVAFFADDNKFKSSRIFSQKSSCPVCGISLEEISPRLFSFNSPTGACGTCNGIGYLNEFDPDKIIPDKRLSFLDGAILTHNPSADYYYKPFEALSKELKFSLSTPFGKLPEDIQNIILYGLDRPLSYDYTITNTQGSQVLHRDFKGVIPDLKRRMKQTFSQAIRTWLESFCTFQKCPECHGQRLKKDALSVLVGGLNIMQLCDLSVEKSIEFFLKLELSETEKKISRDILKEINKRLEFLNNVGLDYLTLSRLSGTLSGGEAQRIRLASQIGSALSGVLYVLDEPSIGLHQRDNGKLISTLKNLRDIGNTIVVVEHDEEMMREADFLVDIGPGAGSNGGKLVAAGSIEDIMNTPESITGEFLSGREKIELPKAPRSGTGKFISIKGCKKNNLKGIDVQIPLGKLVAITGVSGSGKSTFLNQILVPAIEDRLLRKKESFDGFSKISGLKEIDKLVNIDQSPIGRTPRSNPATYVKVFDRIRNFYAMLPESKARGYDAGRFSFNVSGGRCEACSGDGVKKVEMHFLSDVYVSCEVCGGKRFNKETLSVLYKGKSIADVLDMTVDEAAELFSTHSQIVRKLETLQSVGLGYIKLGESALNLSGGEAQRVKLALELSKIATGRTLYILDEPTTGLHFYDVKMLLNVLNKIVDQNNTVVLIEHNLDVIKCADYIIDLGPEGGDKGGEIIVQGSLEDVLKCDRSWTAKELRKVLK